MNTRYQKAWQRPLREFLPGIILLLLCLFAAFFLFAGYIYDHVHFYDSEITAPTCHSEGYTVHTCRLCGDSVTDSFTTAVHTYTAPYTVREPGENTVGIEASYCTGCGDCRLTDIAPLSLMPVLYVDGNMTGASLGATVTLSYDSYEASFTTTAVMKIQGFTAAGWPKKNYNIRFYTDDSLQTRQKFDLGFGGWGPQAKYTMKANYIDCSHARNIVTCRLFGDMVRTRRATIPELLASPNGGCTDGFPVRVWLNGEFSGIYTMNIPKDKWMFGIDENLHPYSAILTSQMHNASNKFRANTTLSTTNPDNQNDWEVEYCSTGEDIGWLNESFNNLINVIKDSDTETFRREGPKVLDIEAVIDYTIMCYVMYGPDNWDKNTVMVTYDGVKWAPSIYDADCAFGLHWNGQIFYNQSDMDRCVPTTVTPDNMTGTGNLLSTRVVYAFFDDFCARYDELRETVLSNEAIIGRFQEFFDSVGEENYIADSETWALPNPTDPATGEKNNMAQIRHFVRHRMSVLDDAMRYIQRG